MRPEILYPLFSPLAGLPGIGPRLLPRYEKLVGGSRCLDMIWHIPTGVIDRRFVCLVAEIPAGQVVTVRVTVDAIISPSSPKGPYRVRCLDSSGFLTLTFFHAREDWLKKQLPLGEERIISGVAEYFNNETQITHPDYIVPVSELETVARIEPIYRLTAGVTAKNLAKSLKAALEKLPMMPEWQDIALLQQKGWQPWNISLLGLHTPTAPENLAPDSPYRSRLAYDELLASQLALALIRAHQRTRKGRSQATSTVLRQKVLSLLPWQLTSAQEKALTEIDADMASDTCMVRLLQGDVGSGKTIVAFLAALTVVEAGGQVVLMAPTEILARQHFETLEPLATAVGISLCMFTGRDKAKARREHLEQMASGSTSLIIGTHALFQEQSTFADLRLAIIDEQHRFGVQQRLDLASKGKAVDILAMTATPIPRTLMLTAYGDMDVSRLDHKPPGRKPVTTRIIPLARLDEVVGSIQRAVSAGAQVYWVCPMIEESEVVDLAAAEERHHMLAEMMGEQTVGLLHGRQKADERDATMAAFSSGACRVLVATTVIEVGVNVPQATIMVIEQAERFGLAQLHQLRGRVGRGEAASSCLLLYGGPLSAIAKARLEIMRQTEDGFLIAEEDLRLRGGGEVLGTRQSGLPQFRIADLLAHADLLPLASKEAQLILNRDPTLSTPRGQALRTLLYLFERDAVVTILRSG